MAESEETTTCAFDDSFEARLTTPSEKAAYKHNIKERLRHQKIQSILEHVGKHVPKPSSIKKETKAKCLRRVVLYMKYLLQKSEELKLLPDSGIEEFQPVAAPKRGRKKKSENKKQFVPKINCRKAQIIFLKKFASSSVGNFSILPETETSSCADYDNSYTAIEVRAEASGSETVMTPKTQGLINENCYHSTSEVETAVSSISNFGKPLPPEKRNLYLSSYKNSTDDFPNLLYTAPKRSTGKPLAKTSTKRNILNSTVTGREGTQIEEGFNSEHVKQRRRRKNRMPAFSMRKENNSDDSDKVPLPNISKVFAVPSFPSDAMGNDSMPKQLGSLAANTNNAFSAELEDISHDAMDKTTDIFSSSNDLYSSILSEFFPDDREGLPSDFLSSSETTTIPSSNEFISDDTDNISFTKRDSMESPEGYPDVFGKGHEASYETLSDIESFIRNETLSKSNSASSSKSDVNLHHNLNISNTEKPFAVSGINMNTYGMSESPLVNFPFIPQPIGIIPDDILNFQTSVPEYFYLYPTIENRPVILSNNVIEGSQSDEFPPGMDLDFCEAFSEATMYSNVASSSSNTCDMLKNVQIKEEVLDMLPEEEISTSLNHLGNFGW